jgi:hypothetical protein
MEVIIYIACIPKQMLSIGHSQLQMTQTYTKTMSTAMPLPMHRLTPRPPFPKLQRQRTQETRNLLPALHPINDLISNLTRKYALLASRYFHRAVLTIEYDAILAIFVGGLKHGRYFDATIGHKVEFPAENGRNGFTEFETFGGPDLLEAVNFLGGGGELGTEFFELISDRIQRRCWYA